ncbi:MAG: hypothetical protein MUC69_00900 [Gemmatimonadales bacterium]|jgi:hypothetical protein|nr:hypothetical protein [Gemmatimonadales bacterium]
MSPEELSAQRLRTLRADLEPDRAALGVLAARLARVGGAEGSCWPPEARAAVIAVSLHGYYGAAESLMARVARVLDGGLPEGPEWHRELPDRMAGPLEGVRPALLSPESRAALRRLLGFRHFFRHAYAVELDPVELADHATAVMAAHPRIEAEVSAFVDHLRAIEAALG